MSGQGGDASINEVVEALWREHGFGVMRPGARPEVLRGGEMYRFNYVSDERAAWLTLIERVKQDCPRGGTVHAYTPKPEDIRGGMTSLSAYVVPL
jgi:hypothetical protein